MKGAAQYKEVQRAAATEVIAQHSDLVRRIAHHLAARLPASVEVDDLIQAGMMGLIEASRSYDADQGASFETYASIRIRGSMIDEIRRGDWVPRSVRAGSGGTAASCFRRSRAARCRSLIACRAARARARAASYSASWSAGRYPRSRPRPAATTVPAATAHCRSRAHVRDGVTDHRVAYSSSGVAARLRWYSAVTRASARAARSASVRLRSRSISANRSAVVQQR